jgi:DNA-binding CsgD family transcriptional regulator/uncharacterized protein YciI
MTFIVELIYHKGAKDHLRGLEEHRAYWDAEARSGVLIGGGPWRDGSGEVLLCEARDRVALFRVLHADPYVKTQVIAHMRVREWNAVMGRSLPAARPAEAGVDGLTAHEERIAGMMVDGLTNRRIAEALSVSTRAVELHITRIYLKLSIRRRAQLAPALNRRREVAVDAATDSRSAIGPAWR